MLYVPYIGLQPTRHSLNRSSGLHCQSLGTFSPKIHVNLKKFKTLKTYCVNLCGLLLVD